MQVVLQLLTQRRGNGTYADFFLFADPIRWVDLHYAGAMCADQEGAPTQFDGTSHAQAQQLITTLGPICIAWYYTSDEAWDVITTTFSEDFPLVVGASVMDFQQSALDRRDSLREKIVDARPGFAGLFDTELDIKANVRNALAVEPDTSVIANHLRAFYLDRIDMGSLAAMYPAYLFDSSTNSVIYDGIIATHDEYTSSQSSDWLPLQRLLWELWRTQHIAEWISD